VCSNSKEAAEVGTRNTPLEPANGSTVTAGTPVVFSAESLLHNAPTFNVASSEALLYSPDIDSGTGSQSGNFYKFTSTKATATPRTIYWTVSFTFTPEDCESQSTFTTPVHTLTVSPSPAETEAAAKKKQEEEATAKRKQEEAEEAVVPAAVGNVSLDGYTIAVRSNGEAMVKLTCTGTGACSGKLTLTDKSAIKRGKKGKSKSEPPKTETIGTTSFSIPPGEAATAELELNQTGRTLLSAGRARRNAVLTILKSSPAPSQTYTENIHLVQQMAQGKRRSNV